MEEGGSSSYYKPAELITVGTLCAFGVALNARTAIHFRERFDTRKRAIFFLAFIDAVNSALNCVTGIVFAIWLAFSEDVISCSAALVYCLPMMACGILLNAELTVIRYRSMLLAKKNKQVNEPLAMKMSLVIFIGFMTFYVGALIIHESLGMSFSLFIDNCLKDNTKPPLAKLTTLIHSVPVHMFAMVSLVASLLIIVELRKTVGMEETKTNLKKNKYYTIPVNATILSVVTLIPLIVIGILLYKLNGDLETSIKGTIFLDTLLIVFRCPLAARLTFAAKDRVDMQSREARQERERALAKQARERRLLRLAEEPEFDFSRLIQQRSAA